MDLTKFQKNFDTMSYDEQKPVQVSNDMNLKFVKTSIKSLSTT